MHNLYQSRRLKTTHRKFQNVVELLSSCLPSVSIEYRYFNLQITLLQLFILIRPSHPTFSMLVKIIKRKNFN